MLPSVHRDPILANFFAKGFAINAQLLGGNVSVALLLFENTNDLFPFHFGKRAVGGLMFRSAYGLGAQQNIIRTDAALFADDEARSMTFLSSLTLPGHW